MKNKSISLDQYTVLDDAYKFFNKHLFDNTLPECMIVLNRKNSKNFGYFHAEQYAERQEGKKKSIKKIDELSLNPDKFFSHPDVELLQTIAHEMVHVWQFRCTEHYPRNGYHDKVWGRKMEEIGLMPSNTGREGGKKTGQQMMEYIIADGLFDKHAHRFLKQKKVRFGSFPEMKLQKDSKKNKVKYSCSCGNNIWGKPGLNVLCSDCDKQFVEA
jgi:predicted SprT family Zn-dependent metalloprotease